MSIDKTNLLSFLSRQGIYLFHPGVYALRAKMPMARIWSIVIDGLRPKDKLNSTYPQ